MFLGLSSRLGWLQLVPLLCQLTLPRSCPRELMTTLQAVLIAAVQRDTTVAMEVLEHAVLPTTGAAMVGDC